MSDYTINYEEIAKYLKLYKQAAEDKQKKQGSAGAVPPRIYPGI